MGGAFVAVADDATAIYWNPAGLATGSTFDAQIDLTQSKTMFLGAAMPALGLAYYRLRSGVSASPDRQNGGSGEVRVSMPDTRNFGVSLVQTVVNTVVVGSTLRVVDGTDRTTFDLDLGTMASIRSVRVGVTARNLRESVGTQRQVRLGAAFVPRARPDGVVGPFSAAFDVDLTRTATLSGDQRQAAIGSEQWWAKGAFGTRVGLHWNTLGTAKTGIAGGLTVKVPHSLFVEGHMTKDRGNEDPDWGFGVRTTF
jgi:hypothetical protein